jgi:hypothetical protein
MGIQAYDGTSWQNFLKHRNHLKQLSPSGKKSYKKTSNRNSKNIGKGSLRNELEQLGKYYRVADHSRMLKIYLLPLQPWLTPMMTPPLTVSHQRPMQAKILQTITSIQGVAGFGS